MGTAILVIVIIILVVIAGLVVFGITGFNKLRKADITAEEAMGGIDVQLTRRADLIPNLVNTVKGYAAHEAGVLEAVTSARANLQQAAQGSDVAAKAAAEAQMSGALGRLFAVAENYPQLQAAPNFMALQTELAETENKLSFARQYYNDAVSRLNQACKTLPWMFFAPMAGVKPREFYQAPAGQTQAPNVQF
ncbi:LemA family protein [Gordonia hirsuta DSM 44140 = NBRC 16056]|uniref:LemA family protein n=1 Tax=Gordonia hirsuta DSM 44140 = NBRC 16056 TaxID=1121927 RepID=L7LCC0_9ACTN|nr:LemA family protein [Gordonia hirsuta]GAC57683.1 LemA family protein [Gordonia hirsuta DSM 44140 = NBRC 16056]